MQKLAVVLIVAVGLFMSCGSSDTGPGCTQGETQACLCMDGSSGVQQCNDENYFDDCFCGQNDTQETDTASDTNDTASSDPGQATDPGQASDPGSNTDPGQTTDPGSADDTPVYPDTTGLTDCEDSPCPEEFPLCLSFPDGKFCAICYPGTRTCENNAAMMCSADGQQQELQQDCNLAGSECDPELGVCISACGGFGKLEGTNAGCDFYAVDLRNAVESLPAVYLDAQNAPFAVIVSNVSETETANVTFIMPNGVEYPAVIPPQSLHPFMPPPDFGLEGTGRSNSAYRITSDKAIVAYQFNPLSNVDVFSNDASLLLPVAAMGTEYYIMNQPKDPIHALPTYFTVIGVTPEPAELTVTVTATITGGGGISGMMPGTSHTLTVAEGEVLNFESNSGDLTGTHIVSSKPIAVFSGHTAARTNAPGGCCADHLEQQMVPVASWGREFVMGRSMERGNEVDHYRIVAAENGTQVVITGGSANPPGFFLQKGQFQDFTANGHVHVSASHPVMLAQILASSGEAGNLWGLCGVDADCGDGYVCDNSCQPKPCTTNAVCGQGHTCHSNLDGSPGSECKPIGDPAMILGVPFEQWQTDFVFLTPDSYLEDYVNISAPNTAEITLDGQVIPESKYEALTGTNFKIYRTILSDGVHIIESDSNISIVVYGYDARVSYGYPGGTRLGVQ
ncbi:MAG: hypothetical protein CMH54_11155 [Myxococcales bacterium]|nr:hypothetical protein [Myxococcales bacterium]